MSDTGALRQEVATRIRERLFGALMAEGLFRQVLQPKDSAEYLLEINLTDVKQVSTASRFLFGTLAGRNRVTASVRLSLAGSTEPIRSFTATGESAAHPASADSALEDAVRVLVQQIVRALRG